MIIITREEAIARIENHIFILKRRDPRAIYITEALEMTIKALEQEPIFDKIRAEVEIWRKDDTNWSDIRLMSIENILDKYKTESEVENENDDN